jgi:hypothetical protein
LGKAGQEKVGQLARLGDGAEVEQGGQDDSLALRSVEFGFDLLSGFFGFSFSDFLKKFLFFGV